MCEPSYHGYSRGFAWRYIYALALAIVLLVAAGCESTEYIVDFTDVPEVVLNAAREAVPGLVVRRVERESTRRGTVYEVYGTANGIRYEIEVTSDGTVLEVERDDDD